MSLPKRPLKTDAAMSDTQIDQRLSLANEIARAAGQITLKYFRTDRFEVIRKGDDSPVTVADQESETYLREQITNAFPNDAIVGEEYGAKDGDSGYCWILDPIDGTKSFISGVPLYGTMVGVERVSGPNDSSTTRESVIGSVYLPGLDEGIYAKRGGGAWHFVGNGEPTPAKVSQTKQLSDCVLTTSEVETFSEREPVGGRNAMEIYHQLASSVYFSRTWGDVFGYLLVATGRADVMIDPILNVWDAAAVQPIIEEAGGRFSDWLGESRIDSGDAIGSNGLVHDQVLKLIKSS
jgi:histidinol phosphatase-like enzyme (inositol monophosphatase family)